MKTRTAAQTNPFLPAMGLVLFVAAMLGAMMLRPAYAAEGMPYLYTMPEVEQAIGAATAPVLIQFDAKWCGYCRALQPHLQKLRAQNTQSQLQMYKVDVDEAREVASLFGVKTLPTMFIVYKGKVVGFNRGGLSEAQLFDWVEDVRDDIGKG